jgi:hypothetical protein
VGQKPNGKCQVNTFLKCGAWICFLIGIYVAVIAVTMLFLGFDIADPEFAHTTNRSLLKAIFLLGFVLYAILALFPYCMYLYAAFKPLRKRGSWSVALVEFVVISLFVGSALVSRR